MVIPPLLRKLNREQKGDPKPFPKSSRAETRPRSALGDMTRARRSLKSNDSSAGQEKRIECVDIDMYEADNEESESDELEPPPRRHLHKQFIYPDEPSHVDKQNEPSATEESPQPETSSEPDEPLDITEPWRRIRLYSLLRPAGCPLPSSRPPSPSSTSSASTIRADSNLDNHASDADEPQRAEMGISPWSSPQTRLQSHRPSEPHSRTFLFQRTGQPVQPVALHAWNCDPLNGIAVPPPHPTIVDSSVHIYPFRGEDGVESEKGPEVGFFGPEGVPTSSAWDDEDGSEAFSQHRRRSSTMSPMLDRQAEQPCIPALHRSNLPHANQPILNQRQHATRNYKTEDPATIIAASLSPSPPMLPPTENHGYYVNCLLALLNLAHPSLVKVRDLIHNILTALEDVENDAAESTTTIPDKAHLPTNHIPPPQCTSHLSQIHSLTTITLPCTCTLCGRCLVAAFNAQSPPPGLRRTSTAIPPEEMEACEFPVCACASDFQETRLSAEASALMMETIFSVDGVLLPGVEEAFEKVVGVWLGEGG